MVELSRGRASTKGMAKTVTRRHVRGLLTRIEGKALGAFSATRHSHLYDLTFNNDDPSPSPRVVARFPHPNVSRVISVYDPAGTGHGIAFQPACTRKPVSCTFQCRAAPAYAPCLQSGLPHSIGLQVSSRREQLCRELEGTLP